MYKINNIDEFRFCMYDTFEDAVIDSINWYIRRISHYKKYKVYALEIQQFINAINNKDYHKALSLGCKIYSYNVHIECIYPKKPLLISFSDKDLKLINQYVKEEVFK